MIIKRKETEYTKQRQNEEVDQPQNLEAKLVLFINKFHTDSVEKTGSRQDLASGNTMNKVILNINRNGSEVLTDNVCVY